MPEHKGYKPKGTKSSSKWLSPQNAQTGDGRTTRAILDGVKVIFRLANGKKAK